jgi:glycosyltransferase involved in cell wall biosynthesis
MKFLFVAPEVCSPWTEGRKRFVHDLSSGLAEDHATYVLTTTTPGATTGFPGDFLAIPCHRKLEHLTAIHGALPSSLLSFNPDVVVHFPYGTFRHLYGIVNLWNMHRIDCLCAKYAKPCLTVMYSIGGEISQRAIQRWVKHLVAHNLAPEERDGALRLGFRFDGWPVPDAGKKVPMQPRLLFMAGMWEQTEKRLDHVLQIRGLGTLLRVGKFLAPMGITLTVAIPLLADSVLRRKLLALPENTWPQNRMCIQDTSPAPEIFHDHDLFIFPYAREETQFVPTSVIEAMSYGVPTVLPDLAFLAPLAGNGDRAFVFRAGSPESLAQTIANALHDDIRYNAVRTAAIRYSRLEMGIDHSCNDLLALSQKLTGPAAGAESGC